MTREMLEVLRHSVEDVNDFHFVLIDNGSNPPYHRFSMLEGLPFRTTLLTNSRNRGYYWPLRQLYGQYSHRHELIGLMHNDLLIYEKGWDIRVREAFNNDQHLGLIGFCGSCEADL